MSSICPGLDLDFIMILHGSGDLEPFGLHLYTIVKLILRGFAASVRLVVLYACYVISMFMIWKALPTCHLLFGYHRNATQYIRATCAVLVLSLPVLQLSAIARLDFGHRNLFRSGLE